MLSVLVGLSAGAAGAFGLSTDLPVSLVGVAVAAAPIPAAAAPVVLDHAAFENEASRAVGEVLTDDRYRDLRLVSVSAEFAGPFAAGRR